jgi:anti-sigma regulatory factor (Ser/Thr protein kinase)
MLRPSNQALTLPATLESLPALLALVERKAEECGLGQGAALAILLAAEEMLVNVISYAYPGGPGSLRVIAECAGDGLDADNAPALDGRPGLRLRLEDQGLAFDPLSMPEPDTSASLVEAKIGGLGIFLAKRKVDRIFYERRDGANVLTLEKFAPAAGAPDGEGK